MIPKGVLTWPKNQQEMDEANKFLEPIFTNMVMSTAAGPSSMATKMGLRPVPRGDVQFARTMGNLLDTNKYISPEKWNLMFSIAKKNLSIPAKIFNKMTPQQIMSELVSLGEKPR